MAKKSIAVRDVISLHGREFVIRNWLCNQPQKGRVVLDELAAIEPKRTRQLLGLGVVEMAQLLRVAQGTVSKYEQGRKMPPRVLGALDRLQKRLNGR